MTQSFQFEIVSPEKLVLSQAVAMVTVPGSEGDYGVLPGHAPIITTLRPGVIAVYQDNDTTISDRFFVAGGFAEVTEERCTVLAEEAVRLTDIDRASLDDALKAIDDVIDAAETDDEERQALHKRRAILEAQKQAVA